MSLTNEQFSADDITAALTEMGREFDVELVPLRRGGWPPDVMILLHIAWETLNVLGPSLATSALWDGLKLLVTRHRQNPGRIRDPLVTYQVTKGDFHAEASVRSDSPELLAMTMATLYQAIRVAEPNPESRDAYDWLHLCYDVQLQRWAECDTGS